MNHQPTCFLFYEELELCFVLLQYLSLPSVVERVDETSGSVVLMIPLTGQRFTLTSAQQQQCAAITAAAQTGCATPQTVTARSGEGEVRSGSNARNTASSLLTRIRRRDSYSRSNPQGSTSNNDSLVSLNPQPSASRPEPETSGTFFTNYVTYIIQVDTVI